MSKLMSVLGIVLLAIGVALALVGFVNPAQMQVYGLTMDTAAILITGGIISIGLGGAINALTGYVPAQIAASDVVAEVKAAHAVEPLPKIETLPVEVPTLTPAPAFAPAPTEETPTRIRFNGFGRKAVVDATAAAAGVVTATAAASEVAAETSKTMVASGKGAVDDTIAALEQAKADIANAIGGVSNLSTPETEIEEAVEEVDDTVEADVDAEEGADGELYVLEERDIRGRPARILSDNTVEAETDEGWMRFENLEHLNEYLDAAGEPA